MDIFRTFRANRLEHPGEAAFLVTSGDRSVPISWKEFTDDIAVIVEIIKGSSYTGTIAILGENSYEWMVAHAACLFSGATAVPIDVNLSACRIAERIREVRAGVLVHSSLYAEKAREARRMCVGVVLAGFGSVRTDIFLSLARERLLKRGVSLWDEENTAVGEDHVSMIVFTSGTTSVPRGVMHTTRALETCIDVWSELLDMKPGMRSLMILPLQHIFGICTAYLMLCNRVAVGVCPDFRRLYDAVERFRVNFIFLVPALAEILAKKISHHGSTCEEALGSPLDWILVGGAPLRRGVYERLTELGVKVLGGYGLTETCSLYSVMPSSSVPVPGCAGLAVSGNGVETKVSEAGELLIKGGSVFKGYYGQPDATAKMFTPDGWMRTGDVGRIDQDGRVWITGRISRTIILDSGKKVSPEELEARIGELPGVIECVVYPQAGTRTIVAEVYSALGQGSVEKKISELNASLPVYMRIRKVVARNVPFPRTTSGKISMEGICPGGY